MCQPSWRAQRIQHGVLHDGKSVFALEGPLESVSIWPWSAARVRQPRERISTASSAIPTATSSGAVTHPANSDIRLLYGYTTVVSAINGTSGYSMPFRCAAGVPMVDSMSNEVAGEGLSLIARPPESSTALSEGRAPTHPATTSWLRAASSMLTPFVHYPVAENVLTGCHPAPQLCRQEIAVDPRLLPLLCAEVSNGARVAVSCQIPEGMPATNGTEGRD